MALDPKAQAALALHRFGVGPRAGSIAAIASDPRGALLAELDRPGAGRVSDADLLTSGAAARVAFAYQQAQRAARQAERAAQPATAPGSGGAPEMKDQTPPASAPRPNPGPSVPQQIYLAEAKARIDAALGAEIGFVERLVWFWSNHFCVSADKGNVRQICGAYEREVIRANVFGRFGDMLLAAGRGSDRDRHELSRRWRGAGTRRARGAGPPSGDCQASGQQARAPFRRRRTTARARRAAGQALSCDARRFERNGAGAGRRTRGLGSPACQAQASRRMGDRSAARRGRGARRDRPGDAGA